MRDALNRIAMLGVALAVGLALTPALRAADEDSGPELDKQRVATCEARGGRLARNQYGQMLCKDAKVKLKAYLAQNPGATTTPAPPAAPVAPAPGVTAKGPTYTPTTTGTFTIPAGTPEFGTGIPGQGTLDQIPPPTTHTVPAGYPAMPPLPGANPPKPAGGTCALRSCLYSSYRNSCQCQQFNSAELCQFKETTAGGVCATGAGMTTALCPAGYSCINNKCDKKPAC